MGKTLGDVHMERRAQLEATISVAWEERDTISPETTGEYREAIEATLDLLDQGTLRVAERIQPQDDLGKWPNTTEWTVHQWVKKAVLLSFRLKPNRVEHFTPAQKFWRKITNPFGFDKVNLKFTGWGDEQFEKAGFRMVPGSVVRESAYIAPDVVLMPSFVNVGAYVGRGTMIDTWATVGACAQIGRNVHLSGGAGIGGVLEPMQANPVIIEDDCFIGARSEVVEGVIVREGAVLSMGVLIGKNTPIVDRTNGGKILYGEVPSRAVVMMGVHPNNNLICPQIVKYRDEGTDAATAINELLRA